jgi:homeobox protein HoxA/B2
MGAQIKSESPLNAMQTTLLGNGPPQSIPIPNPNQPPPQQGPPPQTKLGSNCDKRQAEAAYWMPTETGFINSQPSMAEFLTHLGPESPKLGGQQGYPGVPSDNGMDSVPEYPWMKEKKTARKSSAQGKRFFIVFFFADDGKMEAIEILL